MIKLSLKKTKEKLIKRHLIDCLGNINGSENETRNIDFNNLDNDTISEIEIEKIEEDFNDATYVRYKISFKDDNRYILSSKDEYEQFLKDSGLECKKEFIF
ncbi:Uncharacterised protein [Staphylococcus saprophyticus]|uniref:hypothetical protein n=1 Tax=Staphylococcus saprophyticus TaxID=29385 RepID=UPI000E058539|nr:hypothetical protein [Staphylococcus saprophyticus]SUM78680.1 Uncharacterised protein [Staphylococcus saprophyticus]